MKKKFLIYTLLAIVIIISGCSPKDKKTDKQSDKDLILKYMELKYNQSFEVESFKAGKNINKTPSHAYLRDNQNRKIYVREINAEDKYGDSYIAVLKSEEVKEKLSTLFSEYYDDFSIEENYYSSLYYIDADKNISLDDYLANHKNGIRIMFYINSDDSVEQQREKVKSFVTKLKDNNIKITDIYFAFFDKNVDVKKIETDYSYEYSIDCISRNDSYNSSLINSYNAFWDIDKQDYNYMQSK